MPKYFDVPISAGTQERTNNVWKDFQPWWEGDYTMHRCHLEHTKNEHVIVRDEELKCEECPNRFKCATE